jgi:hypothetical protein
MSNIDMTAIVSLTTEINALQQALNATTDPSAKANIQAQLSVATAQLTSTAQHQQAQADASANILDSLGLFATLGQVVGTNAPTILNLFKIGR